MVFNLKKHFVTAALFGFGFLITLLAPITYFIMTGKNLPQEITPGTAFKEVTRDLGGPLAVEPDPENGTIALYYAGGDVILGTTYAKLVLNKDGQVVSYNIDD